MASTVTRACWSAYGSGKVRQQQLHDAVRCLLRNPVRDPVEDLEAVGAGAISRCAKHPAATQEPIAIAPQQRAAKRS